MTYPYLGQLSPETSDMYDCGGQLLAQPGPVTNDAFFVEHWRSYGSYDHNPC